MISCFLGTPSLTSEGEVLLGTRLDQVFAVSAFPAVLEFSVYVEVRCDDEDAGTISLDVSLAAADFALPIGKKDVPNPPRGEDWPFPPDVLTEFVTEVHVPEEGEALIVIRVDDEIVETKWIRVVRCEFAEA